MAVSIRKLSVRDYHRMAESGILAEDERVELLGGQLYLMSPKGPLHSGLVTRLQRELSAALGGRVVLIRLQDPIQLASDSEPDLAIGRPDPQDYTDRHPTANDVFLLVEVADSICKTLEVELLPKDGAKLLELAEIVSKAPHHAANRAEDKLD